MAKLIGLDVGYGFVKVTDRDTGFSFPSVVGEGHVRPTFHTGLNREVGINKLKIVLDDQLFFVGKNAIRHSKFAHRDLSFTRATGNTFEILFYAALSFFCNSSINKFKVVTGIPIERMHLIDNLASRVKKEKNIKVFSGQEKRDIIINVEDIEIVPQPLGTYWSQVLNSYGQTTENTEELAGIIDIGFKTTDLAAIEDGEYIPEKSITIPIGMSTAYREIATNLMAQYNFEVETYAFDEFVIKRKINVDGQAVDITKIVDVAFERLAESILVEMGSLWRLADFNRLILSGGGGQAVDQYMRSLMPHIKLASDSITANSRGYLSWANRLWASRSFAVENIEG